MAEYLLGNLPITALSALVLLVPLYGGGAVLIREAVRHTGRSWPSILMLALAYGVLEEGIATMSLFNPNYVGLRLLDNGYVPSLGIGVPWTVLVLTLHVVWSVGVPIATAGNVYDVPGGAKPNALDLLVKRATDQHFYLYPGDNDFDQADRIQIDGTASSDLGIRLCSGFHACAP